jgi:hypothetical protein
VADFSTEFQRGWLTSESIVQLKLFGDNSLNIWKSKFEGQQLCVKVSSSEDSQNWLVFEVANLNNEGGKLQPQMEGGIVYHETDFILFQAQVLEISSVAFTVEISLSTDDFPGKLIGFCYLMPRHFKSTTGTVGGATGAARAPKPGKAPILAARCRRRLLFFKIEVRPRPCRPYRVRRR